MNIREAMRGRLFFDGGMGTELYKRGVRCDTALANLRAPGAVRAIHREYIAAGADIITVNSFGACKHENAEELILAALELANDARTLAGRTLAGRALAGRALAGREIFLAMDLGPTGLTLEPYGSAPRAACRALFAKAARLCASAGANVDFILIETMMDINELEIAVDAALETGLPVMATMTFNENGRTAFGTSVTEMAEALTRLGVAAMGLNCGFGPAACGPLVAELLAATGLPVILQPNAGMPEFEGGVARYPMGPREFARLMAGFSGVRLLGGCCGTSPEHIAAMVRAVGAGAV